MGFISEISPDGGITNYDVKDKLTSGFKGTSAEVAAAIQSGIITEDMLVYIIDDDSGDSADAIDLSGPDLYGTLLVRQSEM